MQILAHRGFWLNAPEKNSLGAFVRAFERGFGVELDVRDFGGELLISHDPPKGGEQSLDEVLTAFRKHGTRGFIAINIKADGLAVMVQAVLNGHGLQNHAFVFDMSVPDMLGYLRTDVPVFTRRSEYENPPALYDQCAGVWADAFVSEGPALDAIESDLFTGKRVAVVSPELHRREHKKYWAALSDAANRMNLLEDNLMLCTDYPDDAQAFFSSRSS